MNTPFPKMHVSLYVKDLEATEKFYTSFFGQEASKKEHRYLKYMLDAPALIISFIEDKTKAKAHNGHLGFQVESLEEMNKKLALINAENIQTLEEKGTSCCYALQDKFWVQDPDGTPWEIYYFHSDVKFNDPTYDLNEKDSCCTPTLIEKSTEGISCC